MENLEQKINAILMKYGVRSTYPEKLKKELMMLLSSKKSTSARKG